MVLRKHSRALSASLCVILLMAMPARAMYCEPMFTYPTLYWFCESGLQQNGGWWTTVYMTVTPIGSQGGGPDFMRWAYCRSTSLPTVAREVRYNIQAGFFTQSDAWTGFSCGGPPI